MTTATDHPRARITAMTLQNVAEVLKTSWTPKFGIIECLHDITQFDTFTRIVCERQLQESGVDVFWNDLVCSTATQAHAAVAAVAGAGVDLEALYGPNYEAILGLIQGALFMDTRMIASLGYQLHGYGEDDYRQAMLYARAADCERLLDRVLSDMQLAAHRGSPTSPAALNRHLRGVRALELTSAYYVLKGANADMDEDYALRLTQPMRAYLFPDEPRL